MSVLQFGFPLTKDNPHHPSTITEDRVAYTGTHDNDTMIGWFNQLTAEEQSAVRATLGEGPISAEAFKAVVNSPAIAAFAPAQDLLRLGSEARLNTPGKADGNWTWRMTPSQLRALSSHASDWKSLLRAANRS
jgi:4-alpha-glucanotransferase